MAFLPETYGSPTLPPAGICLNRLYSAMHERGPALRHSCGVIERGRRTGDVDYGSMMCGSNSSSGMAARPPSQDALFICAGASQRGLHSQTPTGAPLGQDATGPLPPRLFILRKRLNRFISVSSVIVLRPNTIHFLLDKEA